MTLSNLSRKKIYSFSVTLFIGCVITASIMTFSPNSPKQRAAFICLQLLAAICGSIASILFMARDTNTEEFHHFSDSASIVTMLFTAADFAYLYWTNAMMLTRNGENDSTYA